MMDHLIRAGDRVVMKMDDESRSWGRQGQPNGTVGTVVGRKRYRRAEPRYGVSRHFYEPGVYERDGAPLVVWDGAKDGSAPESVGSSDLQPLDKAAYDARYRADWIEAGGPRNSVRLGAKLDNMVRIADLPDTPFWELDIVRGVNRLSDWNEDGLLMIVTKVDFWINADDVREPTYTIAWIKEADHTNASRGTTMVGADQLELVERGNIWREAHGEPLVFASLLEEASYHENTGRAEEVRNPASDRFDWTLEQALTAIRNGDGDALSVTSGFFGLLGLLGGGDDSQKSHSVTRFKDRDIGERIRQATIEGFRVDA